MAACGRPREEEVNLAVGVLHGGTLKLPDALLLQIKLVEKNANVHSMSDDDMFQNAKHGSQPVPRDSRTTDVSFQLVKIFRRKDAAESIRVAEICLFGLSNFVVHSFPYVLPTERSFKWLISVWAIPKSDASTASLVERSGLARFLSDVFACDVDSFCDGGKAAVTVHDDGMHLETVSLVVANDTVLVRL